MKNLTCGLLTAVLLSACNEAGDGVVVREWSKSMRELGIYPVFPPREDLYAGDIFVSQVDAAPPPSSLQTGLPPLGLFFSSIDINLFAKAHYLHRPEFPASAASIPVGSNVFDPPRAQSRLKTVAFPFFLKATASGAEVGALIPVDLLPWKAGLGLKSVKSASVTVSSAESYSIPWLQIDDLLTDENGQFAIPTNRGRAVSSEETVKSLRKVAIGSDGKAATHIDVTVISEVFYARTFDVTLHISSDAALSIAGEIPSPAQAASNRAAAVASGISTDASSNSASAASAVAAAETATSVAAAEAAKLQNLIDKAKNLAPLTPGISAGVSMSSTGDIGLRRTYDRPIAIGYRGVRYRISLAEAGANARAVAPPTEHPLSGQDGLGKANPPANPTTPSSAPRN